MAAPVGHGQGAAMLPQRKSRDPVAFSLEMLRTLVGHRPTVLRDADEVQRSKFRRRPFAVVCSENRVSVSVCSWTVAEVGGRRRPWVMRLGFQREESAGGCSSGLGCALVVPLASVGRCSRGSWLTISEEQPPGAEGTFGGRLLSGSEIASRRVVTVSEGCILFGVRILFGAQR